MFATAPRKGCSASVLGELNGSVSEREAQKEARTVWVWG